MAKNPQAELPPHSWPVAEWTDRAPHVYPHSTAKAKYLIRSHQTELLAAGALVRIGRDLVMIGAPYAKWQAMQAKNVRGYTIAPNRDSNTQSAS